MAHQLLSTPVLKGLTQHKNGATMTIPEASRRGSGIIASEQTEGAAHPIIVVGTGPVGIACAQRLLNRDPTCPIILYGDEPWGPYDRVRLTSLLAGETGVEQLANPLQTTRAAKVVSHFNCPVTEIDRAGQRVRDQLGRWQHYSRLVLAVGSSAAIPQVPGVTLTGVYKLRDLKDVEGLIARRARSRWTVVLGGGLLGLEAARAMQRSHTQVTVVHRGPRLLNRQLDDGGAALLLEAVTALGIEVELNCSLRAVSGSRGVEAVTLSDGRELGCDTVIIATGIRPNVELARQAGISVGQGIRVNDAMQTSDPYIYAIGECAEHREQVHGLVAPGLEQARVAAEHLAGGETHYTGSIQATSLKVVNTNTFSIGRVGENEDPRLDRSDAYCDPQRGLYRKVVTRRGRAVGAVALGAWGELGRVREAVTHGRHLWPHQRWRLRRRGRLWPESSAVSVRQWPANATVCNCRAVNRGTLSRAMDSGAQTLEALMRQTGASTVCGSCRPLLEELVAGAGAQPKPAGPISRPLLLASLATLILAPLFLLLSPLAFTDTVTNGFTLDRLWTDGLYKQISGFTLVGLSVLGMALSLRKRTRISLGAFRHWRLAHVLLGSSALALLILHTGLSLGHNLNRALMLNFLALALLGALAGGVIALERKMNALWGGRLRRWWSWSHILVLWPLPALLGFHILAVYYY